MPLTMADGRLQCPGQEYSVDGGVADLRVPPVRLRLDLPWYEPWDELATLDYRPPPPVTANELPHHLDAHLAAVPGEDGRGRLMLEVGCGERQCEAFFTKRGFRYVGIDVDKRGIGPHALADAHNLPFRDSVFDIYISTAVYEHLISPITAAAEAMRVLKPGGVICGTTVFVYGFHDRASFHHMSHACVLCMLRAVGFEDVRIWPDWSYLQSIPAMGFGTRGPGWPWYIATKAFLRSMEWTFTRSSMLARRLLGKPPLDLRARGVMTAGSLTFAARKPESGPG
jgi:SAM-dependent methyltransferase